MIAKHFPNKGRNVRSSSVGGPILHSFVYSFDSILELGASNWRLSTIHLLVSRSIIGLHEKLL